MSYAIVSQDARLPPKQLDQLVEPKEQVTAEQLDDKPRLLRLFMGILRAVAELLGRWRPRVAEYPGIVTSGDLLTSTPSRHIIVHNFGTGVNWWIVKTTGIAAVAEVTGTAGSDANKLVLDVYSTGTMTVHIEESG